MKRFTDQPLSFPGRNSILKETLFLSGYTLFVLFLFQPFGTHEYSHPYKLVQLCGYVLLVLVCYPLLRFGLSFVPNYSRSLKKEAIKIFTSLLLLVIPAFFYHAFAVVGELHWQYLVPFLFNGIVFLMPPFCAILYHFNYKNKQARSEKTTAPEKLEIKGTSQYEQFYFKASDVFYLKSNGNYVMIYFQKDGVLKNEIVRNTLSQVSGQLQGADFTAIHRSFLVNAKKFDKLVREDGKLLLVNRQFNMKLPVSKTNVESIEKKLRDHS